MHKIPRSYTDNNYDEYGGNEYTKYTDSRIFFLLYLCGLFTSNRKFELCIPWKILSLQESTTT